MAVKQLEAMRTAENWGRRPSAERFSTGNLHKLGYGQLSLRD